MSSIKTVSIIGASGNIGAPAVQELLKAGFQVTALTRKDSASTFPLGVRVQRLDFDSFAELKDAFTGQDAVVSTISTAGSSTGQQLLMVDAAVAAGVKRFIPSEFGVADYANSLPYPEMANVIRGKLELLEYLIVMAKQHEGFPWTRICTGLFFNWALVVGHLGFNRHAQSASIYDSGDEPFHVSSHSFIGKATAAILRLPDKTRNRFLVVASFIGTQNKLLEAIEGLSGSKWQVKKIDSEAVRRAAVDEIDQKGADVDFRAYQDLLACFLYGDGKGTHAKPAATDNELLGLESEDPEDTLREWLAGRI
ncbi:aromatic alcohol reductase [Aspergillus stella-maris]|uniref:aromatic alcohol reductase n=1 Tax=Aspergillus stella-maris TaxID=1810926 RepID=UPI003CCD8560